MDPTSSRSLCEVSGSAKMALLSWSYNTMRYLLTREEVTGKRPVWSVLTFPVNSTVCRYAILVRTLGSCKGLGWVVITGGLEMGVAGEVFLVDRTFFRSWCRWPFAVARLLGKCLRTRAEVRPGHGVKKTEVMAAFQVDTTGLNADRWRYCTMSDFVERVLTLFENRVCRGMCATGDGSMLWRSM